MLKIDRRRFLAVFAAASAVAVLPTNTAEGTEPRPEIGAVFHVCDFLAPLATKDEFRASGELRGIAFRRAEKTQRVRLGNYKHEINYSLARQAWCVSVSAEVVGHA